MALSTYTDFLGRIIPIWSNKVNTLTYLLPVLYSANVSRPVAFPNHGRHPG